MKIKILCTLGPASLKEGVIQGLDARGVDLFRINLSHTQLEDVESTVGLIRRYSSTPICLDTEGPQVRCGSMRPDVLVHAGSTVRLTSMRVEGTDREVSLWPSSAFDALQV